MKHLLLFLEITSLEEIKSDDVADVLFHSFPRAFVQIYTAYKKNPSGYEREKSMSGQWVVCDDCGREFKIPSVTWNVHLKNNIDIYCPQCKSKSWHVIKRR